MSMYKCFQNLLRGACKPNKSECGDLDLSHESRDESNIMLGPQSTHKVSSSIAI